MTQIATIDTQATDTKSVSLFRMIEKLCSAKNVQTDKVSEMLNLWERLNAHQSKADFDAAVAAVKPELPILVKNNEVILGGGRGYQYEDLASIANAIDKILAKHGLSYRFNTISTIDSVTVTCKLSHVSGHTEENSLTGPIDKSGAKNPIQALGSSVTYLQRYTLKAALGLAAGRDTDARPIDDTSETQTDTIKPEQVLVLRALLKKTGRSEERLCKHYNVDRLEDLLVGNYSQAQQVLSRRANGEVTQ